MQFLIVEWLDAMAHNAWEKPEALQVPGLCISAGWLAREDDEVISLAGTMYADPEGREVNQVITIPKGMIIKERRVGKLEL